MTKKAQVVAVSGATGYVGSVIVGAAGSIGKVIGLVRVPQRIDDIPWSFATTNTQAVAAALRQRGVTDLVHAAWDMKTSLRHVMEKGCVEGSARLFEAVHVAGVQRLIFISTISAFDQARAVYGRSKLLTERIALQAGGVVIRLGLVYGSISGGVFGTIQNAVRRSRVVPLIGLGSTPQFLLDEATLAAVTLRALKGEFDGEKDAITVAHPQPWPFHELVTQIAAVERRKVILIPIPWPLLYFGLSTLERLGITLNVRSDSVLSFVYQNQAPDFSIMHKYGIEPAAFANWRGSLSGSRG
jgi:nucleoside-diphosphate-sugar epimerase